jgi:carboxymethylenebutenolidase
MTDEKSDHTTNHDLPSDLSRREFVAFSVGAGLAAATTSVSAAELPVVEQHVEVKTPDGTCDAVFIRPTTGAHPGVLI